MPKMEDGSYPFPSDGFSEGHGNFSLRSAEVRELLGRPPKRIVRCGISVLCTVVAALFAGSWFIRYPEVVKGPVTVTAANLPAEVVSRCAGRIDTLFVSEKQPVKTGDILAVLESAACWEDVLWLKNHTDTPLRETSLQLGGIQYAYFAFLKAREEYAVFRQQDYYHRKIRSLESQKEVERALLTHSERQLHTQQGLLETALSLFSMDSLLYGQGMSSKVEYGNRRSQYLQQCQACEAAVAAVDNQRIRLLQLEQQRFDLEQEGLERENALSLALDGARDALFAELEAWEQQYLLKAPCDGRVALTSYWQRNQNVNVGDIVATVVPEDSLRIVGKILLPLQGAGKVRVGQKANIKFEQFPYMEYGMVKAFVRGISMVPLQTPDGARVYVLEVEFPEQLQTNYHKVLPFSQEMHGVAEIVTDDLRLADRLLRPFRAVFTQ